MENFKGTPGDWQADIGADQMNKGLIRVIVASNETPDRPCHAFGTTYEEAMANAHLIAQAKNAISLLQQVIDDKNKVNGVNGGSYEINSALSIEIDKVIQDALYYE